MKYLIIIFGVTLISFNAAIAQKRSDPTRPGVYIQYIKKTPGRSNPSGPDPDRLWFRIFNNGRWAIRMDESGGIEPNHRDVTLYYDIIDSNETVVDRYRCHVCSSNILKSYKSLLFSIESYRIPQGRSIRIEFSYEWENKLFVEQGIEPKHFVFFNLADEGITNDRPR